jgi:Mrp family chromosome partitioning ATPase/capsular polysaccharide biosynthesis protein
MDLLSYLRILRRRWTLIAAVALLGLAIGAGTGYASQMKSSNDRHYKATHILVSDESANSGSNQDSPFTSLDQNALLVTSGDVPKRVGSKLEGNGRKLAEQVLVTTNSGTNTLEITAASRDASESEKIADTFADELMASITERLQTRYSEQRDRITRRLDELQRQANDFDAQLGAGPLDPLIQARRNGVIDEYRVTFQQLQNLADKSDPTSPLSTLESAQSVLISPSEYNERLQRGRIGENIVSIDPNSDETPDVPGSTSNAFEGPLPRGALGGFLGLLAGIGLALVAERLDPRLRSRFDVEDVYGQPVLAEIPLLTKVQREKGEVVSHASPLSGTAEAHRTIRSALVFQQVADARSNGNGPGAASWAALPFGAHAHTDGNTNGPQVVMITSADAKEGKTITTANLAAVYAESGASVLALNCDFRRPMLHTYLGAANKPRKTARTMIPGVMLVSNVVDDPVANPSQITAEQRRVVEAAKQSFDVVLLDTAPLLATNDAIEVVPAVDAVVVVMRPGISTADSAVRARELLDRANAPVAGVVMVGDAAVAADRYHYYSSEVSREAATREPEPAASSSTAGSDGTFAGEEAGTESKQST